jgi:type IV pilus assembly protein PilP
MRLNRYIMKKYLVVIGNLACVICLSSFLWSCDRTAELPSKPKVIRKKIMAKTDKPAASRQGRTEISSKSGPAENPQPVPPTPKTQGSVSAPSPSPDTGSAMVAQKDESAAPQQSRAIPENQKKPAPTPKSEISVTEAPVTAQTSPKPVSGPTSPKSDETRKVETQKEETPIAPVPSAEKTKSAKNQPPIYNSKGKIDPFEPLFKEQKAIAQAPKDKRKKRIPRTPLERIDLSQLKLVAIVLASSGNRAMVEESTGKGYILSLGTYVGTNAGKVVKIDKDQVIVAEEIEDVMGNVKIRNTELKLPRPPGEL